MTLLVPLVLFGWIPAVLLLFAMLPSRRAVITAFLAAWLFLPVAGYQIAGLPDYTKMFATCAGILLATMIFAPDRFLGFRPRWADLPMAVWCLVPFASSLSNGLGVYDGLSGVLNRTVTWCLPYLIGRLYFTDWSGLRELAVGVFIGGLIYVPLCLYEIRMSPQLHVMAYGFHQHGFGQTMRFAGWRPTVFMQHGLMVGMWMATASLMGAWLWFAGGLRRLRGLPVGWLLILLVVTTVLCKSFGAIVLLGIGLAGLYAALRMRSRAIVVLLMLMPVGYMTARAAGAWSGLQVLSVVQKVAPDRASSLKTRLDNEDLLAPHALRRPVFGWGGWGRNRPSIEEAGRTITDGLWIIALGLNGVVGLAAVTGVQLVPALLHLRRSPPRSWYHPATAAPSAMAMILILYCIDNIFNAMVNPIFMLMAGGLTSLCVSFATGPAIAAARSRNGGTPPVAPARLCRTDA